MNEKGSLCAGVDKCDVGTYLAINDQTKYNFCNKCPETCKACSLPVNTAATAITGPAAGVSTS